MTVTELPRTFALEAGAVSEPVGLVESLVKVRTVALLVLPALSVEVTDSVGLFVSPAFQREVVGGDVGAAGGGVDGLGRVRPGADGAAEHGEDRGGGAGAGVRDRVLQLEVACCGAAVVDRVAVQERRAGGRDRLRASDVRREGVVDADVGDECGGEGVADVVGGDHAQVVEPVRDGGGVPGDRVGAGGVGGADVRPGARAGGGALELCARRRRSRRPRSWTRR